MVEWLMDRWSPRFVSCGMSWRTVVPHCRRTSSNAMSIRLLAHVLDSSKSQSGMHAHGLPKNMATWAMRLVSAVCRDVPRRSNGNAFGRFQFAPVSVFPGPESSAE